MSGQSLNSREKLSQLAMVCSVGSKASWDLVILKKLPEYWTRKWNCSMRPFRTLNHVCLVTYRLSMNSWKHLLVKKGTVWNTLSGHLVSMWFSSSNVFVEASQATLIVFYGLICNIMLHCVVVTCLEDKKEKKLKEINWLLVVNSFTNYLKLTRRLR